MIGRLRILLTCLLLLLCARLSAQDPYFVTINKLSGLPSNSIYGLFQDSKGFIWIANNDGLTRYDGFEFKTYINAGQTSRSGNQVEEDKYGRIWYKNFDGYLYYVEDDSLKMLKQHLPSGKCEYAVMGDRLLVAQKQGIDFYDIKTLKFLKSISFDINDMVSELHYKDNYFVSAEHCLYKVSSTGDVEKTAVDGWGWLAGAEKGVLLIDSREGVRTCYHIDSGRVLGRRSVAEIQYMHGFTYCSGIHWAFTPNGVWAYDSAGKNINGTEPFFRSKSISSILKDRDGNYWFGTLNEGILFVPDLNTRLFSTSGFVPNILTVVMEKIYIGTSDNSIYTYDVVANKFERKFKVDQRHEIICFLADTINSCFNFSSNRLYNTDNNFKRINSSVIQSVKDIAIVDSKYYAVATTGLIGLVKVRDDIESDYDSIYKANAMARMDNMSQLIWFCRGRSVAYHPGTRKIFGGTSKGLFSIVPGFIDEVKWNGQTIYARKLIYYRGKIYALTAQNNVLEIDDSNHISSISLGWETELYTGIRKAGDNLYLLAKNGIRILDTTTGKVKLLNLRQGIKTEEINDLDEINGNLIISTERGLVLISERAGDDQKVAPSMVVNKIIVNGAAKPPSAMDDLAHTENDIEINYSLLSFGVDNSYRLFYSINGGKWQANSNMSRVLKLASLSPGAYDISFKIGSTETGSYYNQQPVHFVINKPLWGEWWFVGGCILLLTTGGIAYYKWQTGLLKKQNMLVVEKVELERNLRNSMLTSIRSQMNPHFFYNALNAIQSFIFSDDKRNASTYLVKLSRLTRMILEMSEKESITLDEETEALKLYLELEKMRFSNDFDYELLIASNVDNELVRIPPMIVQPYIENAVKHGLLHKKGTKKLLIAFERVNDDLRISIDDNGIGRMKANEIRQAKKEQHRSFSTDANGKRIDLLNKERNKNIGVLFIDKMDKDERPAGTTVVISIPLN